MYDGTFRVAGPDGRVLAEFDPSRYLEFIGEHVEPWSYLKFPFFKPQGYPEGCYRVGPLAGSMRGWMSTPKADKALKAYRSLAQDGWRGHPDVPLHPND